MHRFLVIVMGDGGDFQLSSCLPICCLVWWYSVIVIVNVTVINYRHGDDRTDAQFAVLFSLFRLSLYIKSSKCEAIQTDMGPLKSTSAALEVDRARTGLVYSTSLCNLIDDSHVLPHCSRLHEPFPSLPYPVHYRCISHDLVVLVTGLFIKIGAWSEIRFAVHVHSSPLPYRTAPSAFRAGVLTAHLWGADIE